MDREVGEKILKMKGVERVYLLVGGDYDLIAEVSGLSWQELGELVINKIRRLPGVEMTHTLLPSSMIREGS